MLGKLLDEYYFNESELRSIIRRTSFNYKKATAPPTIDVDIILVRLILETPMNPRPEVLENEDLFIQKIQDRAQVIGRWIKDDHPERTDEKDLIKLIKTL